MESTPPSHAKPTVKTNIVLYNAFVKAILLYHHWDDSGQWYANWTTSVTLPLSHPWNLLERWGPKQRSRPFHLLTSAACAHCSGNADCAGLLTSTSGGWMHLQGHPVGRAHISRTVSHLQLHYKEVCNHDMRALVISIRYWDTITGDWARWRGILWWQLKNGAEKIIILAEERRCCQKQCHTIRHSHTLHRRSHCKHWHIGLISHTLWCWSYSTPNI